MDEILTLIQSPFILRIFLGGSLLAFVFGVMGYFVSLKKSYFYGEVIAHSSLAGIALGLFFGIEPLSLAFIYAFLIALVLPHLESWTKLDVNNILAIILPFSMGLGVLIFSLIPGYQANLTSFLFGSLVWIGWGEMWYFLAIAMGISLALVYVADTLSLIHLDKDYAKMLGMRVRWYELIYNFMLALTIIVGVKLAGVILINAFIIIPATIAKMLAPNLRLMLIFTPIISVFSVLLGMLISVILNIPSGASIAVVLGLLFMIAAGIQKR